MKVFKGSIFAIAAAGALIAATPSSAAPLNFCNNTSAQVAMFFGYYSIGVGDSANHDVLTGPFVSEGPWLVEANQCQEFHNPFDARYMFWFVIDPQNPQTPDDYATPGQHMCVRGQHATFEDENVSADACHAGSTPTSHAVWVAPHKIDIAVNPTVTYSGPGTGY
jgi:uncharacterized membrane protein